VRRPTLLTQAIAVNAVLVAAAVLAAGSAAGLDTAADLRGFGVLAAALLAVVLVNGMVLRRRFAPLEALIAQVEGVQTAAGGLPPLGRGQAEEVVRLHAAFADLLERIEAERAATAAAVVQGQERERERVARDLHDECNQALTGLLLRLEAAALDAPGPLAEELRACQAVAARAMEELLRVARELRPAALDELGLTAAVRSVVARTAGRAGWEAEMRLDEEAAARLGDDAQLAAYRFVQEALANAARHAGARHVRVEVCHGRVVVQDDGRGFDAAAQTAGLGLRGMRERAALAGGRLRLRTAPGAGTTVELALP
jgi:two-component system, NarL family, sensor histidine kinase UhpB